MILTHLDDETYYNDNYIIKIPKDLYENDEVIVTILSDIDSYGTNWEGTLTIDEPHKYLNKLKNFYGGCPPDVNSRNVNMCIPFEDSASKFNTLKYYLMCAFSFLSNDEEILSYVKNIDSESNLDKVINYIAFRYGRYKYNLSEYQLKFIYTVGGYSSLPRNEYLHKFRMLGYTYDTTRYNRFFSIKYYMPLIDRNIPDHHKINWILVKNPKEVLSLLTDYEIMEVTDNTKLFDHDSPMNRYELINFTYENMKKERFRYIGRDLVVCDRDEIYGSEFPSAGDPIREHHQELTYGIQSTDVGNAYMRCINEDSYAEYLDSRKIFYVPYNNNRLTDFDIDYLEKNTNNVELKRAIQDIKNRSDEDLIKALYSENPENVVDFIKNLFYSGMYIRRWKGVGHEYPINHDSTHISICSFLKNVDPEYLKRSILSSPESFEDKIVRSIKNNNFNFDIDSSAYLQFSFENYIRGYLEKLRTNIETQPDLGTLFIQGDSFNDYYKRLMTSEICIRVSSRYLILLAWELAKFLSGHVNPNSIIPSFTDEMANNLAYVGNLPAGESERPVL